MQKIVFVLHFILFSQSVRADFEFFRGVRQMGMGGASIAVVNDETALLSNPNGLGRLRDQFITIFDPELTTSASGTDTLIGTGIFDSVYPRKVYDQLSDDLSNPYYFKGQAFPSIVMPNFGFGILGRYEILAQRNPDGTYDYLMQNDYSVNLGYNFSFWGGRIKWGVATRLINRVEFFGQRDPATESLGRGSFAREGLGLSVDSGLTLSAPWQWLPTLTFLVRDIGHTSYTMSAGFFGNNRNGSPMTTSQSVDAAIALFPILSNHSRGVLTVEYTGIDTMSEVEDSMDRLHIGTELNLWDAYFIRAGYHQKDWTAGFEYATGLFQWQLATYAEDIQIGTTQTRDRRGILKFAVRF